MYRLYSFTDHTYRYSFFLTYRLFKQANAMKFENKPVTHHQSKKGRMPLGDVVVKSSSFPKSMRKKKKTTFITLPKVEEE